MLTEQNPLSKSNVLVDLVIFVAFLVTFEVRLTGETIHEWLGLALAGTIIVHLLFHWRWLVAVTTRFLHQLFHASRLNYVVDAVLFVSFTVMMFSGLMISRAILPALGLEAPHEFIWRFLHARSADLALILLAVHFGLHWKWMLDVVRRWIVAPLTGLVAFVLPRHPRTEAD